MKRVTRRDCNDAPVPEEQETEGQRQLHSLLIQQLDTGVDIDRCFAKKQCFAPAAFYKPFGEQAAGVKSLSQFQALQNKDKELASLRELGLTDAEILLWRTKDKTVAATSSSSSPEKARGLCIDPAARHERLKVIQEKIDARDQLLSRPQRLSASRPLSRREMEIERALFQGSDRQGFLTALYHQEEEPELARPGSSIADTMHMLYKDFLKEAEGELPFEAIRRPNTTNNQGPISSNNDAQTTYPDQSDGLVCRVHQSPPHSSLTCGSSVGVTGTNGDETSPTEHISVCQPQTCKSSCTNQVLPPRKKVDISQSIGALMPPVCQGINPKGPMTISGQVELIPEEHILANKETNEGIRSIARFQNYNAGQPSNVLCVKNLSPRTTVAQLVSLFSRFQQSDQPAILYRLLTGRLNGQAFITFSDKDIAQAALDLLHGYRLFDKPLIIEFGRERKGDRKIQEFENT